MKIELTIGIPDNLAAENSLWNDLQDLGMRADLIEIPVRRALWEYLSTNYGKMLQVEVSAKVMQ